MWSSEKQNLFELKRTIRYHSNDDATFDDNGGGGGGFVVHRHEQKILPRQQRRKQEKKLELKEDDLDLFVDEFWSSQCHSSIQIIYPLLSTSGMLFYWIFSPFDHILK
ncbi:hypothetical protein DERP_012363 [Dermatophagoides pteronyssinus]|uniref:Uncharacterized protein n=1 Tax=Dermatophagoides pteronyssinus TaxID=6956 RepID=A0ABQ8IUK0_DERPT|nr:hypothetical protein DERP_012363 [Dermatophagoides pteronyssinus]